MMFTGLVAELGTITAINKGETSAVFTINAPVLISEIKEEIQSPLAASA